MLLPAFFDAADGFAADDFGSVEAEVADADVSFSFSFCFPNICSIPDFGFDVSGSALGFGFTSGLFSSLTVTPASADVFEARGAECLLIMPLSAVVGLNSCL